MLIQESHVDVPVSANGKDGSMRTLHVTHNVSHRILPPR